MAGADFVLRELRTKDPRYAELKLATSGLSGAAAATVLDNEGRALAFAKWAEEGNAYVEQQVAHEGRNLSALGSVQGVPQVLHYDPAVPLVAIEFIEVSPTATWTDNTWNAATGVLQGIRRAPLTQLPSVRSLKAFNDRGGLTLRSLEASLPEHLTLAGELAHLYDLARVSLAEEVTCHADTHPDNWLLSHQGPVLIDFEWLCRGPVGFDEVMLLTHLAMPLETRLSWLSQIDLDPLMAKMTAAAFVARLAVGRASDYAPWRAWCAERWPTALDFARALL